MTNKSLTAGASSNATFGVPLVCAKCGCDQHIGMMAFDYEVHDYPIQHPDRCLKLDGKVFEHIIENGEPRPHWRCRKKAGHPGACSSHNDCGERGGEHGHTVCGLLPGHKGPHAWERTLPLPEELSATPDPFLLEVCEELFGCHVSPGRNEYGESEYRCALCEEKIDIGKWVTAEHADSCLINRVRNLLAEHKPKCVPGFTPSPQARVSE